MVVSDAAQEMLETLWVQRESNGDAPLSSLEKSPAWDELTQLGYVNIVNGQAHLTDRGLREAEAAIRRHRLAERLFADVLDIREGSLDEASCQFEHMLHSGLEDRVCELLGHPRTCPHGEPIPQGQCCRHRRRGQKLFAALSDMEPGQSGRVAYIATGAETSMQELMAIGALPGVSVRLIRKTPAYVFALGQSEFAVDEELARCLYVRLH